MNRTFPLGGPIDLDCRISFGAITVHAEEGLTHAGVTLTPRDPESDVARRTTVDLRGSTLVVRAPKPRGPRPRGFGFDLSGIVDQWAGRDGLDIELTVPSGPAMKIASWGADVVVRGRSGHVDIASGANSTDLEYVDGDLRLRYGSGPARVGRVSGSAVVKAGAAEARFGEVGGRLAITCGTGSLDVAVARDRVHLRTGSGNATIAEAHGDVSLVSGSGDLAVGLPAGVAARLDLAAGGQVRSELPIEDSRPDGPAITVQLRTAGGDIHLFRAQSPGVRLDKTATTA